MDGVGEGISCVVPPSASYAENPDLLRSTAREAMEGLRDQVGEAVHLTVRDGHEIMLITRLERSSGEAPVEVVGTRVLMHATANGKAMLARFTDEELEEYLEAPLRSYTELTVTDPSNLRSELRFIRRRGYALNAGEFLRDVAAVAAAIVDAKGVPVGAMSVSSPAVRMSEERCQQVGPAVAAAAARVSAQLGYRCEPDSVAVN